MEACSVDQRKVLCPFQFHPVGPTLKIKPAL